MDANVIRTLNQGPMGPQGPVKVNHCIMNQEAGFEPVARIYSHKYEDSETTVTPTDSGTSVTPTESGTTVTPTDSGTTVTPTDPEEDPKEP